MLRAPGFHAGRHLVRADREADSPDKAASLSGKQLLAIPGVATDSGIPVSSFQNNVVILDFCVTGH
jgi:hypothetical protein